MTYRDDRDADQARIAALEGDLSRANDRIAELEGKQSQALVLAGGHELAVGGRPRDPAARWLGAPLKLQMSRTFDKAIATEHFEDLVEEIRTLTGDPGRTELMKSSMTWWCSTSERNGTGPFLVVTITARKETTVLTVSDKLGHLAGALYGGIGGGVGGGTMALPIFASIAVPVLTPVFILGWLGGTYFGARGLFRRAARRRARTVQQVFDMLVSEITTRL